jgi:putative FmdB family regulatory protein
MPLYEYQCDSCGHRFEKIQKFSDPPVEKCPKCGGAVHKMQSAPAFHLKGTGWYLTDYAKKDQSGSSSKSEGDKDKKESKDTASKETGKTEKSDKSSSGGDSGASTSSAVAPAKDKGSSDKPSKDKPA